LGLEESPEKYVEKMVEIFGEVNRVLRNDGTLWLNLGDSYSAAATGSLGNKITLGGGQANQAAGLGRPSKLGHGLKTKDLIGIPWLVAFALRSSGWYLRQDIIWAKPNPMPESVKDRCTKSHEYIFLMSKSPKYYFDSEAMKEPAAQPDRIRADKMGGNKGDETHHSPGAVFEGSKTRNKRDVWFVTPQPFREAHFATYPPKLIEPCILAGCPQGGTVLDPFCGSGTTGVVAHQHGRNFIGLELNPEYAEMSRKRITASLPADFLADL